MDWHNTQWLLWLAGALIAGLIEITTVDFLFLMIAGGALAGSLAAGLGAPLVVQILVFAGSSGALLIGVRPPLKRWARNTPAIAMNTAALIGRPARVLETVTDRTGQVKLSGEVWTARTTSGEAALEIGSDVHVVRIEGATAIVVADPAPPAPNPAEGRTRS